jgi:predicted phosphoribosyltransferase/dienelactone hydrolase
MMQTEDIRIGPKGLGGFLTVPEKARGLIIFAHGSGSSRHSPRNAHAARSFEQLGFATLLFDLLTEDEARDRRNVFDIALLAKRVVLAVDWTRQQTSLQNLPVGVFGASTGGGAALAAAAASPHIRAVVSRGGRPDLAGSALPHVHVPSLLIVGGNDREVLALNEAAAARMTCEHRISVVPDAGHLFEEPGTLDKVLALSGAWFSKHLAPAVRETIPLPMADREEAGMLLARALLAHDFEAPVIYALPRGGVPVARPIADALNAPLDILMVRKIGVPWQPEVAAASVVDGEGAEIVTNDPVMRATGLDAGKIADLAKPELEEIERRRSLYLPGREPVRAEGRTAILVDDGIATGTSMKAAILAVRKRRPARIVVAVPVAAPDTLHAIGAMVDDAIVLAAPDRFGAVGSYYRDFHQLSDGEVIQLLQQPPAGEE